MTTVQFENVKALLVWFVGMGALGVLAGACATDTIPPMIGASDGGTNGTGKPDLGCLYGGTSRVPGSSFPSLDGCNTCGCAANGEVACTERACIAAPSVNDAAVMGGGCISGGKVVPAGGSVPSPDGCNTCSCGGDGVLACTKRACLPMPSVDAGRSVDVSSSSCTLLAAYDFGAIGGLRIAVDRSFLTPPNNYRHTRMSVRGGMPDLSCSPPMPACGSDAITALDVERLVRENADVKAALAAPTPPVFGRDSRPVDGTVLEFKRADGRGVLVGDACPPTSSSCQPIPAGIAQLAQVLRALDKQQLANPLCKALAPMP